MGWGLVTGNYFPRLGSLASQVKRKGHIEKGYKITGPRVLGNPQRISEFHGEMVTDYNTFKTPKPMGEMFPNHR